MTTESLSCHLSVQEQEACLIDGQTPAVLRHLAECAECHDAVAELERTIKVFRAGAVAWAGECLAVRPQAVQLEPRVRRTPALRWALAVAIPVVLFILAMLPFRMASPPPVLAPANLSDDALLEQVDEQLSVAVPSSMESLTHLVSSGQQPGTATATEGGRHLVQTN